MVTGANRGIGLETARQLAQKGMHVLMGARNEAKGKEAEGKLKGEGLDVEFILLDVDDPKTHAKAAKTIEEKFGKLDVLVNNAGILIDERNNGSFVSTSKTSMDVLRKTFETNFFNVVALTQTLLPLVEKVSCRRNCVSLQRAGVFDDAQRSKISDLQLQADGLRPFEDGAKCLCSPSGA